MKDIVLSIKPCFTDEIYKGDKHVELRKRIGKAFAPGAKLYIYSSSPRQAITGHAFIQRIESLPVSDIRKKHLKAACIKTNEFDEYFNGHQTGVLIWLRDAIHYAGELHLSELKLHNFTAPQSFCYVSDSIRPLLEELK